VNRTVDLRSINGFDAQSPALAAINPDIKLIVDHVWVMASAFLRAF
jgi:hypothetical protein